MKAKADTRTLSQMTNPEGVDVVSIETAKEGLIGVIKKPEPNGFCVLHDRVM